MLKAFLNDMIQRVNTANKYHQRKYLSSLLKEIELSGSTKILDFGCGTGLFAGTFVKSGFDYNGYDINKGSIKYARKLYKNCYFTTSKSRLEEKAPYDLIFANCCFHHIDDSTLSEELESLKSLLADEGLFLMIDILAVENDMSPLHRMFTKLERGKHVRSIDKYKEIIEKSFKIVEDSVYRTSLFSLQWSWFPLFTDLLVLQCKK